MTGPKITVAPNGARLQKRDHPAVPLTVAEIAATARACKEAGADALHLHVRDGQGAHSLDVGLYREALEAIAEAAPGLGVQITTEAAGRYDVADQLHLIETLHPRAASVAVREMARDATRAARLYTAAHAAGTEVQHILYGPDCYQQLADWHATGLVPADMRDAIAVLGQCDPPRAGQPAELAQHAALAQAGQLEMTVCAFGPPEQACLLAAAHLGWDLRVGFENNIYAPDGTPWPDNAAAVASLRAALANATRKGAA
ncbi:MAG: 3-keto-5-aminohexanoate cleavage protein [Paracoccaceae bacterium]|nr:3-keto-5-aminohexanoate cleavage protein [Paracoccaceae bacterium]